MQLGQNEPIPPQGTGCAGKETPRDKDTDEHSVRTSKGRGETHQPSSVGCQVHSTADVTHTGDVSILNLGLLVALDPLTPRSTAITHKDFETLVTFVDTWVDEVKRGDTLAAEATVAGSRRIFESLLHEEGEIVARLEQLAANIQPPENDGPQ